MCTTWFVNSPFSLGEPSLIPSNYNKRAQGPCLSLSLDTVKKRASHFGDFTGDWVKEREKVVPSQSMTPRQRNGKGANVPLVASEPIEENEVSSR